MVSNTTLITGVSAMAILITGYITAIGCLARNKKHVNRTLLWAAIFLACMGSFYLGTVVSFISLLFTGKNIPEALTGQLCYTWAPVGIGIAMYLGFQIIKPKISKILAYLYFSTGIIYWYGLYGIPEVTIGSEIPEMGAGLIDIQLLDFVQILTALYLLTFGVILIGGFSWLIKNSSGLIRKKAAFHVIGYALFVICGALDSMVEFQNPIYILIVRFFMILSYMFMFLGFTKLK